MTQKMNYSQSNIMNCKCKKAKLVHVADDVYQLDISIAKNEHLIDGKINVEYSDRDKLMYSNTSNTIFIPYENTESPLIGNVIVIEENLDKIINILDNINKKLYPLNLEVI